MHRATSVCTSNYHAGEMHAEFLRTCSHMMEQVVQTHMLTNALVNCAVQYVLTCDLLGCSVLNPDRHPLCRHILPQSRLQQSRLKEKMS